ncbi:zinc finger protein 488 [Tiliqua scincoides]|uniref:zinc finger protein 488 n=1 Tax=Tiliqua scincoides TaxID=71010 RepID=UPI0034619E6B
MVKGRLVEQSTNFHSLGRDLELKIAARKDYSHGLVGERRINRDEMENSPGRKMVLLEKTNYLREEQRNGSRDEGTEQHMLAGPVWMLTTGKQTLVNKDALEQKESAFTEVRQMKDKLKVEKAKELEHGGGGAAFGKEQVHSNLVRSSPGSAFSFVWPTRAVGEPKSAFRKPAKCLVDRRPVAASQHLTDMVKGPRKLSELISTTDIMHYSSIFTSKFLVSDLSGSQLLQSSLLQSSPFAYTSGQWPRQTGEQGHATPTSSSSSASLTLLPPTFTSFGVAAQNWCAKCNLSFRMTSDLVFHMRSHHKKESASPESQGAKRRREEKLTCPVCQEYFRERHHLSRHMTSHN